MLLKYDDVKALIFCYKAGIQTAKQIEYKWMVQKIQQLYDRTEENITKMENKNENQVDEININEPNHGNNINPTKSRYSKSTRK